MYLFPLLFNAYIFIYSQTNPSHRSAIKQVLRYEHGSVTYLFFEIMTNRPINQQTMDQPTRRPNYQQTNRSTDQPTNRPTDQQTNRPTNQQTKQPTD